MKTLMTATIATLAISTAASAQTYQGPSGYQIKGSACYALNGTQVVQIPCESGQRIAASVRGDYAKAGIITQMINGGGSGSGDAGGSGGSK
mgnify:CR=1 FL=1